MYGLSTTNPTEKNRLYLVVLLLLTVVLRIPRVGGIIGDDAFRVIWMGLVLSEGHMESWTVSIFSPFGLYPYSFYPIGVPLLLACLLNLGVSYETSVLLISEVMGLLGALGAYCLGRYMFKSNKKGLAYAFLYSVSPIFLRVTYYTLTVRGPFMAVLPWFLLFSWKLYKERRIKYFFLAGLSLLALALMHRLVVLMIFYIVAIVGAYLLHQIIRLMKTVNSKVKESSLYGKINQRYPSSIRLSHLESFLRNRGLLGNMGILPLLISGAILFTTYYVAINLIPIDTAKTTAVFLSNDTFIGLTTNLIIDYGIRFGIVSVFIPIGFLYKLDRSYMTFGWSLHLVTMVVASLISPKTLYTSLVMLPISLYYAVVGIKYVIQNIAPRWTGFLIFAASFAFVCVYHFLFVEIVLYLTLGLLTFGVFALIFVLKRESSLVTYRWHLIIVGILLFSLVSVDGLIQRSPNCYLNNEERTVIECLLELPDPGIAFVMRSNLARRVQSYGIPVVIREKVGITSLYYDWIEPEDIVTWTRVDIVEFAQTGQIFKYIAEYPELVMWTTFFSIDLRNQTQANIAIEMGLQFIILGKTPYGYDSFVEEIPYPSPLLESAPEACELLCETESIALFVIPI